MKSKQRFSAKTHDISGTDAPASLAPTHSEISDQAKAIWEQRGRPEGRDNEIWLEAERRLRSRTGLGGETHDAAADDTKELLGEQSDTIGERLRAFGDQTGDRSATSL